MMNNLYDDLFLFESHFLYTVCMNWWVLKRRPHISWLIAIACGGLLVGVFLAQYVPTTIFSSLFWLIAAVMIAALALQRRYMYLIPVLVVACVVIGLWRGSVQEIDLTDLKQLNGQTVTLDGHVRDDVDTNARGESVIRMDSLHRDGQAIAGTMWVSAKGSFDIKRGDQIRVSGVVGGGFGSFAASMFQAHVESVQRSQPGDVARIVRDWFADAVRLAIPEPAASLGIGYLVGQKRALPADLIEALQIVGLTHVVVASGYNLTILVRLARRLFERVSKYLSALAASAMIASFVAVTGMSPSMSRAGLVAGLSLAAWYYGRRFHPVILLAFAAAVTVMINPSYAWGDLGWQLSFAAFAGVMILAPLFQRFFFGDTQPSIIRQILGETVAAIIVTAPIVIGAFGQFSNVAIIANLLVVPLVPLAMLLTFIAGIGALLFPMAATLFGTPARLLLDYMVAVANYLAQLPWAQTKFELAPIAVAVCYVVLIGVCVLLWRKTRFDLRDANIVV